MHIYVCVYIYEFMYMYTHIYMIIHPRNTQQSHTSQPADGGCQAELKGEILNAGAELGPGVKDDCFASFKATGGELPLPLEFLSSTTVRLP